MSDILMYIAAVIVAIVIIFLVCREIICWYWKVNTRVKLLRRILNELREMNHKIPLPLKEDFETVLEKYDEIEEEEDTTE